MTILVTGATGSVGRLLVDELVAAGAPVRALTNHPARAALPCGVEVAHGYLGKPSTLPAALAGVGTVYLAPLPAYVDDFVRCAQEAGVRRVVVLSGEPADYEAQGDPSTWHGAVATRRLPHDGRTPHDARINGRRPHRPPCRDLQRMGHRQRKHLPLEHGRVENLGEHVFDCGA